MSPSNSFRFPTAFMAEDPIMSPAWTPAFYSAGFTDSFCLRLTSSRHCHGRPEESGCCVPFRMSCCWVALELGWPVPQPPASPCGATVALRAAAFPTLAQWQPHSRRWLNDRDVHTPISGAKATAHADGPAPQTLKC